VKTVVAVDVGGTFTDVSILADNGFAMWKVRSTPDPVGGVLEAVTEGLRAAGASPSDVGQLLHATTVTTNAIFERTGARTAVVMTEGFGHVVHIGREVRTGPERFQITLPKPYPFVAEDAVFEVAERMRADGSVYVPLDDGSVRQVASVIRDGMYETVAVSLLHSYRNPVHEQRVAQLLRELVPDVDVMLSSEVCPEPGEYERTMTTIVSAYISPLVGRYVERLRAGLVEAGVDCDVVVVGSDGAGVDAGDLALRPITSLESGPVAGVLAGKALADELDIGSCLTLDIGGTTSKAGLVVDGRIELTKDFRVGGPVAVSSRRSASAIPVRVPVVDLAEMGVGGGSIAWVDEVGLLRIGPTSAGATPGPASFGLGGEHATVTDAAVTAGIISGRRVLGSDVLLDDELAAKALARVGAPLGLDALRAATAVREVASAEIAAAVQRLLFYRGVDPASLVLMAFGGTGPMHAADVAHVAGIPSILVPQAAGVFTTFGLLSSEIGMEQAENVRIFLSEGDGDSASIEARLQALQRDAARLLQAGSDAQADVAIERSADMRFRHQVQTLPVSLPSDALLDRDVRTLFKDQYERQFGLVSDDDVEVVQLRVRVSAKQSAQAARKVVRDRVALRDLGTKDAALDSNGLAPVAHYEMVTGDGGSSAVERVSGPAVVDLPHTTVVVPPGWAGGLLPNGDLSFTKEVTA
jgi:N-methylhydantoinase A